MDHFVVPVCAPAQVLFHQKPGHVGCGKQHKSKSHPDVRVRIQEDWEPRSSPRSHSLHIAQVTKYMNAKSELPHKEYVTLLPHRDN